MKNGMIIWKYGVSDDLYQGNISKMVLNTEVNSELFPTHFEHMNLKIAIPTQSYLCRLYFNVSYKDILFII